MTPHAEHPPAASDLDGYTLLPGLYQRGDLEQLVTPDADFHIEALPSLRLFRVYRQPMDALPTLEQRGPRAAGPREAAAASPAAAPAPSEPSELRARHSRDHLCFRCQHAVVCAVAHAVPAHLLVTIGQCQAFGPSDRGPCVVELEPIHPRPYAKAAFAPAVAGCRGSEA